MNKWNNLQELLKDRGEKAKLSEKTGISTGNISDWFNPDKNAQPSADALVKIADYFECSVDYLMDRTKVKELNVEPATIYHFPVFKQEAAAGIGRLDMRDAYHMENFMVDEVPNEAVFAMYIKGDSMYNENTGQIKDGAAVLINPREEIYEDRIVIASIDGEVICKRYCTVESHVEFQSDNEERENENKDSRDYGECRVIGVVIGVIEDGKFILVK